MDSFIRIVFLSAVALLSAACGGSGGASSSSSGSSSSNSNSSSTSSGAAVNPPASAPMPALAFTAIKTFRFDWTDVAGATHYKLLEDPDGASGYTQVGNDITSGTQTVDHVVPLYKRVNARYLLQACNSAGCTDSTPVEVGGNLTDGIGYFKASNTDAGDLFGWSVAISGDGNTLAVGARSEASNATGIGGDEADNNAYRGAVYVFVRNTADDSWAQQAYIKASNISIFSHAFGYSVSLSADGNTLAVGDRSEHSNATGVNGDQNNINLQSSGAVYVFTRENNNWSQQAYIKASNTGESDQFGHAVSLSGDGNTLAVSTFAEDSNATGIDGNGNNDDAENSGAVYLYTRSGIDWSFRHYIKASNADAGDWFGYAISLSADGDTLAVGAPGEDSNATGINGDESDNTLSFNGAGYLFVRNPGTGNWSQQAYIKTDRFYAGNFGRSIGLSGDGNTLAIGTPDDSSGRGAVFLFKRNDTDWSQQAYIRASNFESDDGFGINLALSADGSTLAVSAEEDSDAAGINGDQNNDDLTDAGAVYLFVNNAGDWSQQAYIKASNAGSGDSFGGTYNGRALLSLSGDGNTLAVGAPYEDSNAIGINGDQTDNSATEAGAVYLY